MRLGRFSELLFEYIRATYSWFLGAPLPIQCTYPEPSWDRKSSASGRIHASTVSTPRVPALTAAASDTWRY